MAIRHALMAGYIARLKQNIPLSRPQQRLAGGELLDGDGGDPGRRALASAQSVNGNRVHESRQPKRAVGSR